MSRPLRSICLLLLVTTGAQAGEEVRTVPCGRNQTVDFLASVNPGCSSPGIPTVRRIEGPSNGVVTTDKAGEGPQAPLPVDDGVLRDRSGSPPRHLGLGRRA